MSDRPNGAAPAAPDTTPAPREHSEREVAGVLAGLLEAEDDPSPAKGDRGERAERDRAAAEDRAKPPEDESEPPEPPEEDEEGDDDAAADDEPPSDEEGEDGEAARSRVEPPAGWNAKDRQQWNSLPPAVQETIRRRDSEQTARITRATQEQAELARAWTARLDEAHQDRSTYTQNLEVFRDILIPEARALDGIDMQRLANENPAEYVRLNAQRDAVRGRIGWIDQEIGRIQQTRRQEDARRQHEARQFGHARLVEALPEFADAATAERLGSELGTYLRGYGFTDHEIGSVVDHRAIVLAMKAMRAEKGDAAAKRATEKRTPTPAPQVQRPGSSRRSDGDTSRSRMTQLVSRFDKGGRSVKDAASILAEWMP